MESQIRHRLVLIPPPFQGHITPMLQLATILHSKGFSITIAHTYFNSPDPSNHPNFNFIPFFDGLSNTQISSKNFIDITSTLNTKCVSSLKELLVHEITKLAHEKIVCIIYDGLLYFIDSLAKELKLPSIVFRTTSATNLLTYHACAELQSKGYLPLQDSKSCDLVPELNLLRFKDLPIFNSTNPDDFLQNMAKTLSITPLGVIFNTVDSLEDSSLNQLQHLYKISLFPIGPLHMIANDSNNSSNKILQENHNCISWLNNQARKSVLYVSLGSIASWEEKELTEVAGGLSNSRQKFLWVIRPETVNDVSAWMESLSEDVKEGVAARGCVVKWAPQNEVLAHEAVGGFWSHCGWNSTLESLCQGVPIICQPYFGDQRVNARLLSHVWKVGLEWCNVIERDEIERVVRRLMVDQEGEEMRQRAMELKHVIGQAVSGSSSDSLNGLVKCILSVNI